MKFVNFVWIVSSKQSNPILIKFPAAIITFFEVKTRFLTIFYAIGQMVRAFIASTYRVTHRCGFDSHPSKYFFLLNLSFIFKI